MADSFTLKSPTGPTKDGMAQTSDDGVNLRTTPSRGAAAEGGTLLNPGHGPSPDSCGMLMPSKEKGI